MINYNNQSKWLNFKYAAKEFYSKNKVIIFVVGALILLALLTGIFTSIKLCNLDEDIELKDYSIYILIDGSIYSFKYFILRLVSSLVIVGLLFVFSLKKFLNCFGVALLIYRSFLITLNCTFIIIKLGIGGIMGALLIILPCHLICLTLLFLTFITLLNLAKHKRECGAPNKDLLNLLWALLIGIIIIDIVEIILLLIFKPTTILVM